MMQSLFKTFLKLCFCNCPHQPAMSCMHKKISLITERHVFFFSFFFFTANGIAQFDQLPTLFTSLRKTYVSQKYFEAFLKLNLPSKKKVGHHSLFKIKRGLSRASRFLYPGPGARNTR